MATTSQRRLKFNETRQFGSQSSVYSVPDLTVLQTRSYDNFLQYKIPPEKRENKGLESVLREVFPIESYDKTMRLEYLYYELEKPRFSPDECRQLRLTYGRPFRVRLRLVRAEDTIEEDVYLGELPIMLGGGEFIINGAERVVVSQLHRSPGVDFIAESEDGRKSYKCRIIPERGSWIELNIARKETLIVCIDQSTKFPIMTLLRAMDPAYSTDEALLRAFYPTSKVKIQGGSSASKIDGKIAVVPICYPSNSEHPDEVIVEAGQQITKSKAEEICSAGIKSVEIMDEQRNKLLLNSLEEDKSSSHEEALLLFYKKMRPGNPPQLEKAKELFKERFFDTNRYRLGRVGRFRMNRKLGMNTDLDELVLNANDIIQAVQYLNRLWGGDPDVEVDDIDHLGNRRVRTIDELAAEELRKGFIKLRRTAQERLQADATPRGVINQKSISAAIEFFFGRGELSQVVDQTNPLSMLTHERRLSALGPGGLNRKRAGFDVRDVHSSHYGRICPIETPEGTNIGLITSLSIYAKIDEFGFLVAPYRKVEKGKITNEVCWLRADEEHEARLVPADLKIKPSTEEGILGEILPDPVTGLVIARYRGDYEPMSVKQVQYIDISPNEMIGVSAGLIPFLEHDDANRALMGSNMQRQAVPLLISEAPIVATGLEVAAAENSSLLVKAAHAGKITYVDAKKIVINDEDVYILRKFVGLNERTCQNQRPCVVLGQEVAEGEIIADGASTDHGVLALGRNVLAAFMVWEGYNYEDAIIISEEFVQNDTYTSLHIEEFDTEIRETKLGREEFTRDIPNVGERALRNLDENGIVRVGTYVKPGDILVGKISPKNKSELTPEEKLLHAIFGRAGEDVKNESLEVPSGVEGIVIGAHRFCNRTSLSELERREFEAEIKRLEEHGNKEITAVFGGMIDEMEKLIGDTIVDAKGESLVQEKAPSYVAEQAKTFSFDRTMKIMKLEESKHLPKLTEIYAHWKKKVEDAIDSRDRTINSMACGDQLKRGVLQMVKVYIAAKRVISVGDKMAGRHGNKGVIARILPKEDMPFLEDGTPIQIMLNPLGVPSRMNVGQILETHLGWAASKLGYGAVTPVFDGATEGQINDELEKAGLPRTGKVRLYDGRTGEPFGQETTVGYIYMLKLHHLVDDKVHARSTGPYSLITQQPLGGKARFGGQRFGEMEVWALEAYGAAYTLQELLTVKSDDVEGRTKIYESMVKGENTLEAGTPASFDVLVNEIKGLALDIDLVSDSGKKVNFPNDYSNY
ncbi:MAG: DNA-directed RNA polymerase subunit beta [Planctomycetia bacterium]|nr:DNA-directed RNA polymerase subunit beta [Planctomycetia bacterium]